ncbi:CDP-alcohol phosphatidyltransferase family protein [Enterovibrio calviensis]|uniref:CDP-alcohol phosphatidyltransferase family protein n=1 Tax=Enterovibrio calviensis TaxID=91359 RepID=UPI000482870B|nr:CDP-alcohol phosphatidyltransferase family protein [Enterovibrio calviensis]
MLDSMGIRAVRWPLARIAEMVDELGVGANQTTVAGFAIGLLALPALAFEQYGLALLFILLNRMMDGLDGALARIQGVTDAGGFLDISLDFLFYSLVPFGFVLANPDQNALAGAFLIFSFIGTGSSFLAFAIMAGKQGIDDPVYKNKSLYYMTGLTEGSETILCFVLMCVFPAHFVEIACVFGAMCWFTTSSRIYNGFQTLNKTIA